MLLVLSVDLLLVLGLVLLLLLQLLLLVLQLPWAELTHPQTCLHATTAAAVAAD